MNKPFDLQAALAGKPVVNGFGVEVLITKLSKVCNGLTIISQSDTGGILAYHTADGKAEFTRGLDLFMSPITATKWVNLWDSPSFHYTTHPTEADARTAKGTTYTGRSYAKLNPDPIKLTYEV